MNVSGRLPIATKRILFALARQLVVAQFEACECGQLAELRWDATCEATTSATGKLVKQWRSSEFEPHSRTRQLVRAQAEHCERSQLPEHGWNATCETNSLP